MRCGRVAASPRVCRHQSSYPEKFPSKKVTLLLPSRTRMWVAILPRNQRLCEMTITQPANC